MSPLNLGGISQVQVLVRAQTAENSLMQAISLLLIAVLVSIISGQLIRLPFLGASGAITLADIFVLATDLTFIIYALAIKKSLKIENKIFFPALLFILSASASTFLAAGTFKLSEILISSLFLIRFIFYFFLSVVIFNVVTYEKVHSWFKIILSIGTLFTVVGLFQFVLLPNLSFLTVYGWDPHQQRIASTLLDPNFSGMIFVVIFAISISLYLYQKGKKIFGFYPFVAAISFIALILTFSRSSYLALLVAVTTIGILKSPKLLISILTLFLVAFLLIGQVRSRIIGAFTLDETAKARLESWQKGAAIFKDNLLFGVGFNTYRYAQERYGFFSPDEPLGGHSGAGSDSSIILVAATTGIVGLSFYLFFLLTILRIFAKRARQDPLHLASFSIFLALLVHSQFVNSLFFPQIMLILWFILGLVQVYDT